VGKLCSLDWPSRTTGSVARHPPSLAPSPPQAEEAPHTMASKAYGGYDQLQNRDWLGYSSHLDSRDCAARDQGRNGLRDVGAQQLAWRCSRCLAGVAAFVSISEESH
jgi:hypothetical protein